MKRVLPADRPWSLHQCASSQRIERQALAGQAPHALMHRAGDAVARLARALVPHGRRAWVAAGPGNNGGDGLDAAMCLQALGWQVTVSLLADPERLPADARDAFERAQATGLRIVHTLEPGDPDIALDALLGLGSTRPPEGPLAQAIAAFNALGCPRLAIDLPSGLNADSGQPWGASCAIATHTLSLLTLKPGLFTGAGRDHSGEIWFDDLGIEAPHGSVDAWLSGHRPVAAPKRLHAQHKGSFGDLAVVGGAPGMAGAALLAARAALAAGAGRVYVDLLDENGAPLDSVRPELMFRRGWHRSDAPALKRATVVAGCGGSDAVGAALPRLLSLAGRLVLDADALNLIARDTQLQQLLRARATGSTVITPHPLEAARLLESSTQTIQSDRIAAAKALAERHGCVVILKGSGSVLAAPGQTPVINATGNAALASAGTGDVLAGWTGGRWSASTGADAFEIARQSVALHGHAAELAPLAPLRASDLIEAMYRAQH